MKTFKLNGFEFVKVSSDTHINMFDASIYTKYIKFCPKLKLSVIYKYNNLKIGYLKYIEFRIKAYKNINYYKVDDVAFNISDGLDCQTYYIDYYSFIKYMSDSYSKCEKVLLLI